MPGDKKNRKKKTANTFSSVLGNMGKYFFNIDDEDLIESKYKPSKSKNPNQKYYVRKGLKEHVINNLFSQKEIEKINNQQLAIQNSAQSLGEEYTPYQVDGSFNSMYDYLKKC